MQTASLFCFYDGVSKFGAISFKNPKTLVKIDAANAVAERNQQNNETTLLLNKTSYFPIATQPDRLNQI
ncbi:MAG: hypothetical protein EAZ14_00160 [Runella slithyformis]|nr:MAG: hypothetical protein EAZ14_00160 [Runella slithyformis]